MQKIWSKWLRRKNQVSKRNTSEYKITGQVPHRLEKSRQGTFFADTAQEAKSLFQVICPVRQGSLLLSYDRSWITSCWHGDIIRGWVFLFLHLFRSHFCFDPVISGFPKPHFVIHVATPVTPFTSNCCTWLYRAAERLWIPFAPFALAIYFSTLNHPIFLWKKAEKHSEDLQIDTNWHKKCRIIWIHWWQEAAVSNSSCARAIAELWPRTQESLTI